MYKNEEEMKYALIGYNNSIHTSTNFTPFELVFGHTDLRDPNEIFSPKMFYSDYAENHKNRLETIYKNVKQDLNLSKEKIIEKANIQGDENKEYFVGQIVYKKNPNIRSKNQNKFLGPYKITKLLKRNIVEITGKDKETKKEVVHIKKLKKPSIVTGTQSTSSTVNNQ